MSVVVCGLGSSKGVQLSTMGDARTVGLLAGCGTQESIC